MQVTKSFARNLLNEFKLRKFGFQHTRQELFYRSQWQSGNRSVFYLIFRWIWAIFFIGVFGVCLALQLNDGKLFIFLTNWGILLCMLTQLIAVILTTRWHPDVPGVRVALCESAADAKATPRTPKLVQLYWLLHGASLSLALVITTVYWAFLYGKMNKPMRFPALSFITHCLNSVFMLVDFFVVAFPVRILHTAYWMLLPILYCLFTVLYFFCGGTDEFGNHYVYPILDWTKPLRGVITFAGVFCLYLVYAIVLFSLAKFRRYLARILSGMGNPHSVGLI